MRLIPKQYLSLATFAVLALSTSQAPANELARNEADSRFEILRTWLPYELPRFELIFEFDSENPEHAKLNSVDLHREIDTAHPTIVIVEALNSYDRQPRVIGGYNPHRWRNWWGEYEEAPGRFVFDLNKRQKWERQALDSRSARKDRSKFGLTFGRGDLEILPNLRAGSARNHTFAADRNTSVLTGQAGEFAISKLQVYRLEPQSIYESIEPLPTSQQDPREHYSVPDISASLTEALIGLVALFVVRYLAELRG